MENNTDFFKMLRFNMDIHERPSMEMTLSAGQAWYGAFITPLLEPNFCQDNTSSPEVQ